MHFSPLAARQTIFQTTEINTHQVMLKPSNHRWQEEPEDLSVPTTLFVQSSKAAPTLMSTGLPLNYEPSLFYIRFEDNNTEDSEKPFDNGPKFTVFNKSFQF